MKYVITAKSPDSTRVTIDGSWVVEAGSSEEAFREVRDRVALDSWLQGSTWTIRAWTSDDDEADV